MAYVDLLRSIHHRTKRNYLERVHGVNKAECARIAKRFDRDYWDGDRQHGYGGYRYDGRWRTLAQALIDRYELMPGDRVLDIGCGKGHLLHDFTEVLPGIQVAGIDVSRYALEQAMPTVKPLLQHGSATELPWSGRSFDLVVSINALHNLYNYELCRALREIERVGRGGKYLVVDSYRTEEEKVNLLYWQLTCECFYTPAEWEWLFGQCGYSGDYGFSFYENDHA